MSEAFEAETRLHFPNVEIVYDLFHVEAKYGREVLDRVRVDETNRIAKAAGPGRIRAQRRVIKGARWQLLRIADALARKDRIQLRELLAANRRLWVAYVLKDALKALWRFRYRAAAQRAWQAWYGRAIRSRIPALIKFAKQR